ncbi:Bifunctional protein FolD 1 [Bienertia sinuspersici]
MSKHSNKITNNPPTSNNCFAAIFQTLLCTSNLPIHHSSASDQTVVEKPGKIHPYTHSLSNHNDSNIAIKAQVHVNSPGVIAKLMGLDSLPNDHDKVTNDMLFRSKSLNSLQFLPDFNPTRIAFHRRARTSASFHEQGHKFLATIDENLDDNGMKIEDIEVVGQKSGRVKDSGSKNKYDECYYSSSSRKLKNSKSDYYVKEKSKKKLLVNKKNVSNRKVIGSTTLTSKKGVDHEQDMCIEVVQSDDLLLSRSPISVLDHHKEFSPNSKGKGRQIASKSRTKSSPKLKINDGIPQEIVPKTKQNKHKLVKEEVEVADKFLEMLGNICKLTEEQIEIPSGWQIMIY